MAQIRGTAGYNLGHQNPFGGPGSADATSDPSPLDAIREQTSKIEDWLDTLADPVKPYVPCSSVTHCFDLVFSSRVVIRVARELKTRESSHTLTPCSFAL
jgi:hypothetical protein